MLLLASSSETRAKILSAFGVEFVQKSVDYDEDAINVTLPRDFVYIATLGKMNAAKSTFGLSIPLLCADTVVSVDGEILRKAVDRQDAKRLLQKQSGANVKIITCTMYTRVGFEYMDMSVTEYEFAVFDEAALESYLDGGEWRGKAGAIMVEGFAKPYIKSVVGYESCAMGLTIEKLLPFI